MPKHYMIIVVALLRQTVLRKARRLVEQGRLDHPDQIFNRIITDIDQAEHDNGLDLRRLAKERSAFIDKARRCHQVVRLINSRGRIFNPAPSRGADGELIGVPISPGGCPRSS